MAEQKKAEMKTEATRLINHGGDTHQNKIGAVNTKQFTETTKDIDNSHKVYLQVQLQLAQRLNDQLKLDLETAQARVKLLQKQLAEAEKASEYQKIKLADTEKAFELQKNIRPVV